MARVFAPVAFVANEVSTTLLDALRALPEDVVVLLEFYSPGPDGRQVDVAVLGPNGVDVIEVKNKRGTVLAEDHGPWLIRERDGRTSEIPLNTFRGRSENPWDQADRTAKDFLQGVRTKYGYPNGAKVFPAVLVPVRHPDAKIGRRSFVNGLNGVEDFQSELRSLYKRDGREVWSHRKRVELAERLGLVEAGIATVSGTVVSAGPRAPLPGIRMRVGGVSVSTDEAGTFSLTVAAGMHEIEIDVPGAPEPWRFDKVFAQGPTTEWVIPVSIDVPPGPPSGDGEEVARAIKELSSKIEMDRAERDALFELMADMMERLQAPPQTTVAPSSPNAELDAVLRELQAMRGELAQARAAETSKERLGTIDRRMELVLALERARVDELQAIVPVSDARWWPERQVQVDVAPTVEAVDVEVLDVREAPRAPVLDAAPGGGSVAGKRPGRQRAYMAAGVLVGVFLVGVWVWRGDALPVRGSQVAPSNTSTSATDVGSDVAPDVPGSALPGVPLAQSPLVDRASGGNTGSLPGVPIVPPVGTAFGGVAPASPTTCPAAFPVKGNVAESGERIFHVVGQEYYDATRPEACFEDASAARAAGFRASLR